MSETVERGDRELCWCPASELVELLRRREVSAVEVLEAVLGQAERLAPVLNPFSVRLDERALSAAKAADEALVQGSGGPLCGLPMTIKDSQWLAGVPAATGSRARASFVPTETCAAVERLEQAGAVIFAKTTVPEFCHSGVTSSELCGVTANPWDLNRTPGGSSGGSAAAVAAGLGPVSLGGDGGGSIRIPAAFCGVVGFKPTFGAVPKEPSFRGWGTLVALGPLGRTVKDCRLVLEAIAGLDDRDRHSLVLPELDRQPPPLGAVRVVASEDLGFASLDDDVRREFRAAMAALEDAGVEVVRDSPGLGSSIEIWATLACSYSRWAEGADPDISWDLLEAPTVEFLDFGGQFSLQAFLDADHARDRIHRAYVELFARTGASVLVTPTVGCEAFPHGMRAPAAIGGVVPAAPWYDWAGFLYDANLAGFPACAIPIGFGDDGLPVSLHLLGKRGADSTVLAVAEAFESVTGQARKPPDPLPSGAREPPGGAASRAMP